MRGKTFFKILVVSAFYFYYAHAQLRPGAAHVCSRTVSYNTYIAKTFTRIGYDNYRTCCKRVLRACVDRCTRYRSKIVSYTNSVLQIRYKPQYYCCPKWARSGDACTIPICNPGCKNGRCVNPDTCSCHAGFHGKLCEHDINECAKKPCSQICNNLPGTYACACKVGFVKPSSSATDGRCNDVDECKITPCKCAPNTRGCLATCSNTIGSFGCSCNAGFQLTFDQKTCIDINECSSSSLNTCQQKCHNTPGAYTCSCNSGYLLNADGRTCRDVNECSTLNGGCNQICVNQPGSFLCQCERGYRLSSNQRTCVDINECTEQKPCDNQHGTCTNTPGKYTCGCQIGYKLGADKKTCSDINECTSNTTNGCAHNCHNTDGSYTCSCKIGYRLNSNQRTCDDINECTEKTHTCAHNCHNNVGSYTCSCRPGYKLASDGRTCIALPCETITKPLHGQMSCTGYVTDEHCTFSCHSGFYLTGSASRMCQHTATWSGTPSICNRKPCPNLAPPTHGSLLIPCIQLFGSSCVAKCGKGFYLVGSKFSECVMKEEKTTWLPNNATCNASMPCYPNPCQHGGTCSEQSDNSFTCYCSGTSYAGKTCNTGIVIIPSIPQLIVGRQSDELTILAKPDEVLEIRPVEESNTLVFEPAKFIVYPSDGEATFKVNATKAGIFKVKYHLVGRNAPNFNTPKESTVYAYKKSTTVESAVDISTDFYRNGCEEKKLLQCNRKLTLLSTCAWGKSSYGFISAKTNGVHVPVSTIGVSETDMDKYDRSNVLYPLSHTKDYLENRKLPGTCPNDEKCPNDRRSSESVNYIVNNNIFQRSYYSEVNKLLPFWLRVAVNMKEGYFAAENFQSALAKGNVAKNIKECKNLPINDNDEYSVYLPKIITTISFLSSQKSSTNADSALCILINLCRKDVDIALPTGQTVSFDADFASAGLKNLKMVVRGLGHQGRTSQKCVLIDSKRQCVNVDSYLDASMNFATSGASLNMNGKFWAKATDNALTEKLETKREFIFEGSAGVKLDFKMFGGRLQLQVDDDKATSYIRVGESASCPACDDKGLKVSMKIASSAFKYESNRLMFEPESDTKVYMPYDIAGGQISSVKNENEIKLRMRLYQNLIPPRFVQLKKIINSAGHTHDVTIITKYCDKVSASLTAVQATTSGNQTSYIQLKTELDQLKKSIYDCSAQLKSLQSRFHDNNQVNSLIRILQLQLKQVDLLKVEANQQAVTKKDQGKVVSFNGKICLHRLCFDQADVAIYDLDESLLTDTECSSACRTTYEQHIVKDAVVVTAKVQRDVQVASRITLRKNDGIRLIVNKNTNLIHGSFNASVKFFGVNYRTTFIIKDDEIMFEKDNVVIASGLAFTVKGRSSILTASWKSIVYHIRGVSYGFAQKLKPIAQEVFEETANTTSHRLKGAMENVKESYNNLLTGQMSLTEAEAKVKTSSEKLRLSEAAYKTSLNLLNTRQTEFDSYLKTLEPLFIKKNVETVCKLESCKETCVSMPVCQTCQDPVIVDVNTLKCEQKEENIKTSTVHQVDTKCDLTKYAFIPYYTGSCSPDPRMQKIAEKELEKSLVQTGTAVGTLLGSVVPGLGNLIGGAIGGLIGYVGSLFNSCDESYEVQTKKWIVQEPCTLLQTKVTTVTRPFSVCFDVKKRVQTGFDVPRTCKCKVNNCIAKSKEITCLVKNQNCQKNRQLFLKASDKIPKKFTTLYTEISENQEQVATFLTELQTLKKTNDHNKRELERIKNNLRVREQDSRFANKSYADAVGLLKMETCIMNHHMSNNNISSLLNIKNVQFNINLPLVNNIRLNIDTKHKNTNTIVPYVYDLEADQQDMLKFAAQKVVETTLCHSSRRRRSVESDENDLAFKSWVTDGGNSTATAAQLSCATLKKIMDFLRDSVNKLDNLTHSAMRLQQQIKSSEKKLLPTLVVTFSADTNTNDTSGSLVKANRELLSSASKELSDIGKQVSVKNVLKLWKEEVEVFTGLNNITVCLGYEDCVNEAITTLINLPAIYKVPKARYLQEVMEVKNKFNSLLSHSTSLESISRVIHSLRTSLTVTEDLSLHCASAPIVSLLTPSNITLEEGGVATLRCAATSQLPVKYYWMHHETLLDEEHTSTLTITASSKSDGVYKCIAKSLVGNSTANETVLTVFQPPKFIEKPSDITHVFPVSDTAGLALTCNVSSHPKSTIEWFHSSLTSEASQLLVNETSTILTFDNLNKNNSGFYFCKASNKYGTIKSRLARVDVLPSTLTQSKFQYNFDVIEANITGSFFTNLTRVMKTQTSGFPSEFKVSTLQRESTTKVTISITVSPNSHGKKNVKDMLKLSSGARQAIANAAAIFVSTLIRGGSSLPTDNGKMVRVDNDTLSYDFKLDICQEGSSLHSNGFLCVACPLGSAGANCSSCPANTFADKVGQATCTPCKDGEITEQVGSRSQSKCIEKRLRQTDIVFLLDKSRSFLTNNAYEYEIKKFIPAFMKAYNDVNNTRFALITIDAYADEYVSLNEYKNPTQISRLLKFVNIGTYHKHLSLGLMAVKNMVEKESGEKRKKIVVVLTNGMSRRSRWGDGFELSRKASFALQSSNVHVIAVGVGRRIDFAEVQAIASYPKKINAILSKNLKMGVNLALKQVDAFLLGSCFKPSLDIGVLIKLNRYRKYDEYNKDEQKLLSLLKQVYASFKSTPYYFLPRQVSYHDEGFEKMTRLTFEQHVIASHRHHKYDRTDVYKRIEDAELFDLTEDYRSLSKIKSLLLITENPLDGLQLKRLQNLSQDDLSLVNFVFNQPIIDQDGDSLTGTAADENLIIGYKQVETFLMKMEDKLKRQYCI